MTAAVADWRPLSAGERSVAIEVLLGGPLSRTEIARRLAEKGWALRRLDLKRRGLQDRWNEINNMDEFRLRTDAAART